MAVKAHLARQPEFLRPPLDGSHQGVETQLVEAEIQSPVPRNVQGAKEGLLVLDGVEIGDVNKLQRSARPAARSDRRPAIKRDAEAYDPRFHAQGVRLRVH